MNQPHLESFQVQLIHETIHCIPTNLCVQYNASFHCILSDCDHTSIKNLIGGPDNFFSTHYSILIILEKCAYYSRKNPNRHLFQELKNIGKKKPRNNLSGPGSWHLTFY